MASLAQLEAEYQRLVAEAAQYTDAAERGDPTALAKYKEISAQIRAVISQIEALQPTNSAGQVIASEQEGFGNNTSTQNPPNNGRIRPAPETGSNAEVYKPDNDSGTNGTLRPYLQTQSVPPGSGQISAGPVREDSLISGGGIGGGGIGGAGGAGVGLIPGGQAGVGPGSDDTGTGVNKTNNVVSQINSIDYGNKIIPQPNILDQYASYTYQASLYLITDAQYKTMINTKRKDISGAQLLVQTGGASAGTGRNDNFSLDYYIDNIQLNSFVVGKGTGLAHNVADVKFTVTEPNGITFLKNLDAAVQQFVNTGNNGKKKNYVAQLYLLVIRFYGYDDQGNLVRGGVSKPDLTSDPNAFVEKWYPILISNVKFKIQSKAVEYQIEAMAVPYQISASAKRGSIPYNIELSGQTLKDLLAGPAAYSAGQSAVTAGSNANTGGKPSPFANTAGGAAVGTRLNVGRRNTNQTSIATQASVREVDNAIAAATSYASAPPKADAANTVKKTVRSGLMAALNEYQQDLKNQKIIEVADNYEIEFAIEALASAKITNPGLNISATSMSKPGTAADQKLGAKQSMDPNSRVQGATAGMQIVQFLDNLVRNSSYIKSQQIITIKESNGEQTTTGVNIQNTSWYKISFEATPIAWDNKRNDYAYNIKYIISPYKIAQLNSPYFKPPIYNGSHKQYTYWFTGQNDSVLSYEENLNSLYYQIMSHAPINQTSNALELLQYSYQTRSGQSDQSAKDRTNEPSANAADQLYSINDLGECNLSIVGDPAWLQQGEAWAGIKKGDAYAFKPFLADGTINFDSQQILFEIGYNLPADYDLYTGLAQPSYGQINSVSQQDQQLRRQGQTQTNKIYLATEVRSHFARGKFTQDLKGSLLVYYPDKTVADQNQRLSTQNAAIANTNVNTTAPKPQFSDVYKKLPPGTSVTDPRRMGVETLGTQAILRPTTNGNLTDPQLRTTPVYIQARKERKSDADALAIARAASQNGTNDYRGSILPGFRDTSNTFDQLIVKDR